MDSPEQAWTYESAHGLYRKAGWSGVLPLPAGKKFPPPDGFTGWHGLDPSGADSQEWIDDFVEYRGTGQLALRMPSTVVGIDVDHGYGGKAGGDTMAEAMRRWGPIPLGPHSTARGDGPSGIWFYRVPKGTALRTRIVFPELGLGSVEIIQRHHRYAVVWPSVHPDTGRQYQWYGLPEDAPSFDGVVLPRSQDLPPLPAGWLKALAGADEPGVAAADPETVSEFAKRYATGTEPGAIRGVLRRWENCLATKMSRHDAMMEVIPMAAREARMGRFSAADARAQLRGAFMEVLKQRDGAPIAPSAARAEFDNMWAWGVSQALKESEAELVERRDRARTGTAADPMARPSADNFWEDEGERPRPPGVAPAAAEPAGGGYVTDVTGTVFTGDEEELTPEELAERQFQAEVAAKVRSLRIADQARELLRLETAAPFETLDWDEFLDSPQPQRLVSKLLYRDGTSKVFGPPGSTKSFFVLDLALSMATGTPWRGMELPRTRVHYVMAEGRSVNVGRTHAWLHQRGVSRDAARGWFTAVPQGVLLTEQGIRRYTEKVTAEQPGWIILDTKNRMMVGNENDGSDSAVMIRALDSIRQAAGVECNVTLIDHTGLNDNARSRGSNAVEAAMDTEIKVVCVSGIATVEVTRDKNAEIGHRLSYRLEKVTAIVGPDGTHPAVVVPCDDQEATVTFGHPDDWQQDLPMLPDILEYRGDGYGAVKELARFMRARARGDIGVSRLEARQAVMERYPAIKKDTIYRAWSALIELGRLSADKKSDPIGRSHWAGFDDDPAMP